MTRLFVATSNPGKLREFQHAAEEAGLSGLRIEALPHLREIPPADETGDTFEANARLKALHYSAYSHHLVFADDSGLAVDALDGAPGVYSARFAGVDATDAANNALLLERMQGVENRAAQFVCVIALARAGVVLAVFEGIVRGELLEEPQGTQGFGYDPLFFHPPSGCTTAELSPDAKFAISHRGEAFRAMLAWLREQDGLLR